jgi:hypothetical protein
MTGPLPVATRPTRGNNGRPAALEAMAIECDPHCLESLPATADASQPTPEAMTRARPLSRQSPPGAAHHCLESRRPAGIASGVGEIR